MFVAVLKIAVVACTIQLCLALTCYRCNSSVSPRCMDLLYTSIQPLECPPKNEYYYKGFKSVCTKIITHDRFNAFVVIRNCSPIESLDSDPCTVARQNNVAIKFCGICSNKDGCNSGNSLKFFFELSVFGILLCIARLFA